MFERMTSGLMGLLVAAGITAGGTAMAGTVTINGAGASFPDPAYKRWAWDFGKINTTVKINYQAVGSGAGLAQIKAATVDFGASDEPLKKEDLDKEGLVQFPMLMGAITPVVNIEGVAAGKLKLTGTLLADIFLGKVKKWNDPAIAQLNEGLKLPDTDITVVYRSDGSGTTWNFTNYLTKVSESWMTDKGGPGCDKAVKWPVGVGGQKNAGVAVTVQKVKGGIGYVELAYAIENKMTTVSLKNKDGNFVTPTLESTQAAAANADWTNAPGFYMILTEQPGAGSWPIVASTYILMKKDQKDAASAKELLSFFNWCYTHGDDTARKLLYVAMPDNVVEMVRKSWGDIKAGGAPIALK